MRVTCIALLVRRFYYPQQDCQTDAEAEGAGEGGWGFGEPGHGGERQGSDGN